MEIYVDYILQCAKVLESQFFFYLLPVGLDRLCAGRFHTEVSSLQQSNVISILKKKKIVIRLVAYFPPSLRIPGSVLLRERVSRLAVVGNFDLCQSR